MQQLDAASLDALNSQMGDSLISTLGITITSASPARVEATMPVDSRTRQPFGVLHGGASLALAETAAGVGSLLACSPDEHSVGMQVNGSHVSSAPEGDTILAVATIIHRGRTTHVWNVDLRSASTDRLISTIRVTNCIRKISY